MLKCCLFGTVRMDVHVYQEYGELSDYEEITVDKMSIELGGSVYNTASILNEMKHDVVFYTLNTSDEFADFIKLKMINRNITFVTSKHEKNNTATSLIFVDKKGKKKMISYDGERQDCIILNKLLKDIEKYDLFYTSFYEINKKNLSTIIEIMSLCKINFVDLSPLIYNSDIEIFNDVLEKIQILSGTDDEYNLLLKILKIESIDDLIRQYKLKCVFVKKGDRGGSMYYNDTVFEYSPKEKCLSRDTTGCGDAFNAIVIDSIAKGTEAKDVIRRAVDLASMVAYEGFNLDLFSKYA